VATLATLATGKNYTRGKCFFPSSHSLKFFFIYAVLGVASVASVAMQ
jgi:hypothetical protein